MKRWLSDKQADMMQHALGYGHRKLKPGWRNHYATEPGCDGWEEWQDLIEHKLAIDRGQVVGGLHILSVTQEGRGALAEHEHREEQLRGQP